MAKQKKEWLCVDQTLLGSDLANRAMASDQRSQGRRSAECRDNLISVLPI
jgi:hypothetical protein